MIFRPAVGRKSAKFLSSASALPASARQDSVHPLVRGNIALARGRFGWRSWCVETSFWRTDASVSVRK